MRLMVELQEGKNINVLNQLRTTTASYIANGCKRNWGISCVCVYVVLFKLAPNLSKIKSFSFLRKKSVDLVGSSALLV